MCACVYTQLEYVGKAEKKLTVCYAIAMLCYALLCLVEHADSEGQASGKRSSAHACIRHVKQMEPLKDICPV